MIDKPRILSKLDELEGPNLLIEHDWKVGVRSFAQAL